MSSSCRTVTETRMWTSEGLQEQQRPAGGTSGLIKRVSGHIPETHESAHRAVAGPRHTETHAQRERERDNREACGNLVSEADKTVKQAPPLTPSTHTHAHTHHLDTLIIVLAFALLKTLKCSFFSFCTFEPDV